MQTQVDQLNNRMRTEIDLNESEIDLKHFLKANVDRARNFFSFVFWASMWNEVENYSI